MNQKRNHAIIMLFLLLVALLGFFGLQVTLCKLEKAAYPRKCSEEVQRYATENGLEEAFVYAVIRTESGFRTGAQSTAGARGLMQMTEETFDWLKPKIASEEALTFADFDLPDVSIRFGTYFLALCMQHYGGDIATAAAAYHSGMGKVDALLQGSAYTNNGTVLHTFPYQKMNHYVEKIKHNYQKYKTIYAAQKT